MEQPNGNLPPNAHQIGGLHYHQPEGVPQHWDLVDMYGWDYFQGQITKYLMRWRLKNGLEDLHKARHYLDKYIEIEAAKAQQALQAATVDAGIAPAPIKQDSKRVRRARSGE